MRTREPARTGNAHGVMSANPLAVWIERLARSTPDRTAVKTRWHRGLTYGELDRKANRAANTFAARGLRSGDRIALWMDDAIANVEIYVAAAKLGLVLVPMSEHLQAPEVEYMLESCDPRAVVYADSVAERLGTCHADGALDDRVLWRTGSTSVPAAHDYEIDASAASSARPPIPQRSKDEPFVIAFSSGTTGRPKGAMITARNIAAICPISAMSRRLSYHGVGLIATSISFPATIMASVMTNLSTASTLVLMGRGWDVEEMLTVIERERATYTTLLSPHVREFTELTARRPDSLASLRSVLHSGSKAAPQDLAALYESIGSRLIEVWGMVEHSGGPVTTTTIQDYERDDPGIFGTVGRPVPECEVEVVDETGSHLPHDGRAIGELILRSPAVMAGYWGQPDATARAIRDGWYYSGDLGSIDEHGYVSITDRRNDLIVSGGANIYPSEVERVLRACDGIADAVVVAMPHERWGRTPVAMLVREPGARTTEHDVLGYVTSQLASYKKPTQIRFTEALPVNVSGKVLRAEVIKQFEGTSE